MRALICAASGALLIAISTTPPQAAPLNGTAASSHHAGSAVVEVADRRCSRRNRSRHCRDAEQQRAPKTNQEGYGYSYGAPRAEFYPAGSAAWWQAMEREGRTGITPD
jgi:hypothetical protein